MSFHKGFQRGGFFVSGIRCGGGPGNGGDIVQYGDLTLSEDLVCDSLTVFGGLINTNGQWIRARKFVHLITALASPAGILNDGFAAEDGATGLAGGGGATGSLSGGGDGGDGNANNGAVGVGDATASIAFASGGDGGTGSSGTGGVGGPSSYISAGLGSIFQPTIYLNGTANTFQVTGGAGGGGGGGNGSTNKGGGGGGGGGLVGIATPLLIIEDGCFVRSFGGNGGAGGAAGAGGGGGGGGGGIILDIGEVRLMSADAKILTTAGTHGLGGAGATNGVDGSDGLIYLFSELGINSYATMVGPAIFPA